MTGVTFTEISVYFRFERPWTIVLWLGKPFISPISFLLHSRHVDDVSLLELLSLRFLHFKCLFFPQNKKQAGKQARHPDVSWVSLGFLFFSTSGKHNWKQHSLQVSMKQAYLLGLAQAWSTMLITFVFSFHCHYCSILRLLHIFVYKILNFSTQTLLREKQADKTAEHKFWK